MSSPRILDFGPYLERVAAARCVIPEGRVSEVVGMLVEVRGLTAPIGSELEVEMPRGNLALEVLGFRAGTLLAAPLGPLTGVEPGARVTLRPSSAFAEAGDQLLGRVIDALGNPLDGKPPPRARSRVPLLAPPPPAFTRRPIDRALDTKVRVLDSMVPLGLGQRIGLFAGTGVGKSTLLGMMCRHAKVDVTVVGLVGERGREVGDFVRHALGEEGLARSVVVAATSDMPPLVRARGALRATAIAEHFRDQGLNVLLVMDSVTRYAMALREASLAAGEPPLQKGYTPTVFAALPALLERAGTTDGPGSITAVYTVLVEGDDLSDPIADAVRGILDGHVVLSRKLADRGVFPAVDVLKSLSRIVGDITTPEHQVAATKLREQLAVYADALDLIQIGAYVAGSDPRVDRARILVPKIEALVRQSQSDGTPRQTTLDVMHALARECV